MFNASFRNSFEGHRLFPFHAIMLFFQNEALCTYTWTYEECIVNAHTAVDLCLR